MKSWTSQQLAVFNWMANRLPGRDALQVEARAGTGKTTTIEHAVRQAHEVREGGRALLGAFNHKIAVDLRKRMQGAYGVTVKTMHAAGFDAIKAAWGQVRALEEGPISRGQIVASTVLQPIMPVGFAHATSHPDSPLRRTREAYLFNAVARAVARIASIGKLTLTTDALALADLAVDMDREPDDELVIKGWTTERCAALAVEAMIAAAEPSPIVDFDDMLWIPWMAGLSPARYDLVIIDEAQDMNAAQLALAMASRADGGRIVVVGDPRQAIYGFMGADVEAFARTRRELAAEVIPLTVTFRCPLRVVAAARSLVPDYEAAPGAHLGVVRCPSMGEAIPAMRAGDFVISRTNAGAVGACLALLRHGTRAAVQGRDVAGTIKARIKSFKVTSIASVIAAADGWHDLEIKRSQAAERPSIAERATDLYETILTLCEGMASVDALIKRIDDLFAEQVASVVCCTVHKAKGLEAERVWLLTKSFWPSPHLSEENLRYVAITRAIRELHLVDGPGVFAREVNAANAVETRP